ncbi:DNA methylase N-4/N-6 domain protein [Paraburkholderia atlantica]|uniref:site-specific DNA-methyltransferase (adenine-specific) n=1 Tax=Paraburkholderia atlantica TaxID=2654982 RepID=D5WMD5_PARAM|nr:DNA methylase N-4/N-6 domain protein [Paraburkholderia atlantica]
MAVFFDYKKGLAVQISSRSIDGLIPYARNARTHSESQIAQIAASIEEFGMVGAIVVRDGVIAKGHGTLAAIRILYGAGKRLYPPPGRSRGAEPFPNGEAPVLDASGWTESQFRAFVIADNQLALLAGWNEELLRLEVTELRDDGFDVDLLGFKPVDLAHLLDHPGVGLTDEDDAPEPPEEPVSVAGDVWICGSHRVMCGDSLRAENVSALMGGYLADLIITDPPYNVAYVGKTDKRMTIQNDAMQAGEFSRFLLTAHQTMFAAAKGGAGIYVFHADTEGLAFRGALLDAGFKLAQCCVWVKQSLVLGRQDYHWQHEPVLYGWKPTGKHRWYADRSQSTVWSFDRPARNDLHPTMKPVAVVEYPIQNSSRDGDLVLDTFGGSGTTLIACEKCGRRARLLELDPVYCDVIVARWQAYTGLSATHETIGTSFEEIAAARRLD